MAEEAVEPKPEIWTGPPALSPFRLIGEGVRNVGAQVSTLGLLAVALTAATAAIRLGAREAGVSVSGTDLEAGYFAYEALVALATSLVSGLMLRAILTEGAARFRLDRGLVAYTAITAAAAFFAVLVTSLMASANPSRMLELAGVILGAAVLVAIIYVYTKLLLWPIGRLMGDPTLTPARSWALMHRASWAYILALALTFAPLMVLYFIILLPTGFNADLAPVPFLLIEHAVTAAWVALCSGIAAAVWRARMGGEEAAKGA